jgi:hypothetical protein
MAGKPVEYDLEPPVIVVRRTQRRSHADVPKTLHDLYAATTLVRARWPRQLLQTEPEISSARMHALAGLAARSALCFTCVVRAAEPVGLLFDKRYAQPAAVTNWQNSFEQDGRTVQLKLSFRY